MQLNADNINGLSTRLLNLEYVVASPSPDISSKVDPTVWSTMGSIISQDTASDFETSKFWVSFLNDIRKWKTDYYDDKRRINDFQKQLIELCSQMKGDLIYLDDAIQNAHLVRLNCLVVYKILRTWIY